MRVAICAFVMLEVLATASSMNTEGRQLRMVNRLTEANPKPKPDDRIEATNPTVINKKGETVAKAEKKIAGTPADKVAVKDTVLKVTVAKKIAGSPVDKAAVKGTRTKLVGPKNTEQAEAKAEGKAALKAARTPGAGEGPKMHAAKKTTKITTKVP